MAERAHRERKGKRGAPRLKIDYELVAELAGIGCTDEEIATCLGVTTRTLERRRKDDAGFSAAERRGKSEVRMSLRRQQLRLALDGDKTMLIWLGKVLLGQKESMQLDANVRREEVVQHHVISNPTDLAQFVEALREAGVWERIAGWNGEDAERESVH